MHIRPKHTPGWYNTSGPGLKVAIPDTENRAVWLSGNGHQPGRSFIVSLPKTDDLVNAETSADGTVVYPEYQKATDIASSLLRIRRVS
ncbi:MAG: hypothetical protein ABL933_06450 [Methyloglobulus sp.]|nr:hypothetical protein [Methyloglobulus sp.]